MRIGPTLGLTVGMTFLCSGIALLVMTLSTLADPTAAPLPQKLDWSSSQNWQEARALYEQGKIEEAAHLLEAHRGELESNSAAYFYNLGTMYARLGRLGTALAHFEKANRLEPHDTEIQHNLQLARTTIAKLIGEDHLDPASTWNEQLADRVSLEEVRGALGLFGLVLVSMWIRGYLRSRQLRWAIFQPGATVVGILFGVSASLYAAQRIAADHPAASLVDRQTVRSGPGDRFIEMTQVEAGAKVRVLGPKADEREEWLQVRYSPDGIGWIRASSLLLL